MSKFKSILPEGWLPLEFKSGNEIEVTSLMVNKATLKSIIEQVEQTVLAKLAEQEPVAWTSAEIISGPSFVDDDDYAVMYKTKSHLLDDFCGYPEATPVPLYAHPIPTIEQEPVIYLYAGDLYAADDMGINDHIREHGTPLYTHPAPALEPDYFFYKGKLHCNDGGTHLNHGAKEHGRPLYDLHMPSSQAKPDNSSAPTEADEALRKELDLVGLDISAYSSPKEALEALIDWHVSVSIDPRTNGGWQLVPVEPTENQIISAMEASLLGRPSVDDEAYVMSIIEAYLSAAPKYTGENVDD